VQVSCVVLTIDDSTELVVLTIDDSSNGVSMLA
jgi:hypothetical protein